MRFANVSIIKAKYVTEELNDLVKLTEDLHPIFFLRILQL